MLEGVVLSEYDSPLRMEPPNSLLAHIFRIDFGLPAAPAHVQNSKSWSGDIS